MLMSCMRFKENLFDFFSLYEPVLFIQDEIKIFIGNLSARIYIKEIFFLFIEKMNKLSVRMNNILL